MQYNYQYAEAYNNNYLYNKYQTPDMYAYSDYSSEYAPSLYNNYKYAGEYNKYSDYLKTNIVYNNGEKPSYAYSDAYAYSEKPAY